VGRLFAAGFIPGVLMGICMMVQVYFLADKFKTPREKRATFREILRSFYSAFGALFAIVIILGGIFSGIFTATEAAGVAAVYAMILGFLMYRDLSLKGFFEAFKSSVKTTIQIMFIVVSATLFAWILAKEQFPQMVATFMLEQLRNYYLILFSINALLLIIGCFMETVAVVNILVPVFIPIMQHLNIDPVHFGVMMIINLMIGVLTPPFGSAEQCGKGSSGKGGKGYCRFYYPDTGRSIPDNHFPSIDALFAQFDLWQIRSKVEGVPGPVFDKFSWGCFCERTISY
jgi:tripartite ATP-independent transporter DctM subunit